MTTPFVIDHFDPADRSRVDALMVYLQQLEHGLSSDRTTSLSDAHAHIDYLIDLADQPGGLFLVASANDLVVGFSVAVVDKLEAGDQHLLSEYRQWLEITDLVVDPNYQRLGIGSALLEAVREHGRQLGLNRLKLDVLYDNHVARATYRSLGFKAQTVTYVLDT
ncbi:MAG: GNAT family N-acetyltransferase [Proteobacteria bacterium]|nr:GNAT family N-acetyltransferase [Pseudomonadota bacterium]